MNAYTVKVGDVIEVDGHTVTITGFSYGGHVRWDYTPPLSDPSAWDTHVLWGYWVKMVDDKRTSNSRCKGCRHWFPGLTTGYCKVLCEDQIAVMFEDYGAPKREFSTSCDFGCIHWDAKQ